MSKRIIITQEDQERMHSRFMELMSHVKPIPGDIDCINILKKVKPAFDYHRLAIKNAGNKHEKPYRQKRYNAEKDAIYQLEGYVKRIKQ